MCENCPSNCCLYLKAIKTTEQLGSVGKTNLFFCHQWVFVCTRASVHLGMACANTPTHGGVTDVFLKRAFKVQLDDTSVKCVRKRVRVKCIEEYNKTISKINKEKINF